MKVAHFGFVLLVCTPASALAWDFTCSPRETTTLTLEPPNVMMMLDRSGSMDDADGVIANTCRVCEDASGYRAVGSAAECPSSVPFSASDAATFTGGGSGYAYSFPLTVPVATRDLELEVGVRGDFGGACEWADVYADGVLVGQITNAPQCGSSLTYTTLVVPRAFASDGLVNVEVVTSPDGNDCNGRPAACVGAGNCDGVDATCATSSAVVRLSQAAQTYRGTQTWADPCGTSDKWAQAVSAIDAVTAQSDGSEPQVARFGLGVYHSQSTAYVAVDCALSNHDPITDYLATQSPGGNTPTARAIRTSLNSACVTPPPRITREQSADAGTGPANAGWDLSFRYDKVPVEDVVLEVFVEGDFDGTCEFAAVHVDGDYFGHVGTGPCGRATGRTFTVPASYARDGRLNVLVDARGRGDATGAPLPRCGAGQDGVDAVCLEGNGATVRLTHTNAYPAPSATILINDGAPTASFAGATDPATARDDAMVEACTHRATAPLFVVGLGAGTDVEYNDVLAAAGGTGSCTNSVGDAVDPCGNPRNWEALHGRCDGSIQASSRDELLSALQDITAQLACTFNVNMLGSGYTSVPVDPSGEYEYLYIEAVDARAGGAVQIPYLDSATAVPPGEGWEFANDARTAVRFTDAHCARVQSGRYTEASTQLACLCQQETGAVCDVPDHEALGVCPTGTWVCVEGVDICEPDPECCVPGASCDTGLLGICAEGVIVCDGPPLGTCVPVNDPQPEVCDLLDNDCDGEVDEDTGGNACAVPGGVGRCAEGVDECVDGALICNGLGAMPEFCNGLDDDCDGAVDNLEESWRKSTFAQTRRNLPPDGLAAACRFIDVCVCPDGVAATHEGETFQEYLDAWSPVCTCGDGLAPADDGGPMSLGSPAELPAAGCSAVRSTADASGLAALLLLGLARVRRRR